MSKKWLLLLPVIALAVAVYASTTYAEANVSFIIADMPETSSVCLNESYRQIHKTAVWNINNDTYDITKAEIEYCPYGCNADTGICSQPSYMQVVIVIALFFIAVIAYLIIRVR
jgi:uncharacterized membrane protein YhdT